MRPLYGRLPLAGIGAFKSALALPGRFYLFPEIQAGPACIQIHAERKRVKFKFQGWKFGAVCRILTEVSSLKEGGATGGLFG